MMQLTFAKGLMMALGLRAGKLRRLCCEVCCGVLGTPSTRTAGSLSTWITCGGAQVRCRQKTHLGVSGHVVTEAVRTMV